MECNMKNCTWSLCCIQMNHNSVCDLHLSMVQVCWTCSFWKDRCQKHCNILSGPTHKAVQMAVYMFGNVCLQVSQPKWVHLLHPNCSLTQDHSPRFDLSLFDLNIWNLPLAKCQEIWSFSSSPQDPHQKMVQRMTCSPQLKASISVFSSTLQTLFDNLRSFCIFAWFHHSCPCCNHWHHHTQKDVAHIFIFAHSVV